MSNMIQHHPLIFFDVNSVLIGIQYNCAAADAHARKTVVRADVTHYMRRVFAIHEVVHRTPGRIKI